MSLLSVSLILWDFYLLSELLSQRTEELCVLLYSGI